MTPFSTGPATVPEFSGPRVIREIEHKFRVHGLFVLPDLAALGSVGRVEDVGTEDVDSIYLDTTDLRLIREGFALRCRYGGDDEGWHLKLPVAGADSSVHDELRVPLTDTGQPPPMLTRLVHTVVRKADLTEVARLRGRRHRLMIRDTDDVGVAMLVDDTMEVVERSGEVTARFRELELDPIAAAETTEQVVHDIAKALNDAGALGGDFVAKAVRALGPPATAPPEVPAVDLPDDGTAATVGDVVAATLASTIRAFRAADLNLRRDPDSVQAADDARTAARRLRTTLLTHRERLDPERTTALLTMLDETGTVLSRLHEVDVVIRHLLEGLDETTDGSDTARDLVTTVLGTRREQARDEMLAMVESSPYLDLHEALVAAVHEPLQADTSDDPPAADVLPELLTLPWKNLTAQVDAVSGSATDADWQRVLVAAREVRYAAEAVARGIGAEATRFADAMAEVTDLLRAHHDARMAAQVASTVADEHGDADTVDLLGRVAAGMRARADRAVDRFPAVWTAAAEPEQIRWFGG